MKNEQKSCQIKRQYIKNGINFQPVSLWEWFDYEDQINGYLQKCQQKFYPSRNKRGQKILEQYKNSFSKEKYFYQLWIKNNSQELWLKNHPQAFKKVMKDEQSIYQNMKFSNKNMIPSVLREQYIPQSQLDKNSWQSYQILYFQDYAYLFFFLKQEQKMELIFSLDKLCDELKHIRRFNNTNRLNYREQNQQLSLAYKQIKTCQQWCWTQFRIMMTHKLQFDYFIIKQIIQANLTHKTQLFSLTYKQKNIFGDGKDNLELAIIPTQYTFLYTLQKDLYNANTKTSSINFNFTLFIIKFILFVCLFCNSISSFTSHIITITIIGRMFSIGPKYWKQQYKINKTRIQQIRQSSLAEIQAYVRNATHYFQNQFPPVDKYPFIIRMNTNQQNNFL